ncbi:hypothetical protein EMIHUDRAFT_457966 [Emiliania huxleyi CCMP1516]|uniref:Sulfatase N-terminal domain-containing protein n=2 Tax=Emiliania huxleyi TaxID=2903 RepID=A0A0D3JJC6_EMIH1|nr:hypothetical protein EMIHUDRAFT_457966 [Emiliania huxleyi CCMP1516]EOD23611.1 hypothetical protein EMIHUDRAFT_457966 [Emiliania huxleyi CCMP1516]|eukprot:XP_005776040.1 hypothetical protein EMIHUDRAFT_457966 [Emiliania huxleyi CCMP1516]
MRLFCWCTLLHALSVAAGSESKKNSSKALTCKLLNSAWRRSAALPPPPAGYPSSPYARGPAYPRPGNATPNVLLMLGDDVGYGDLAAFGGHPYARTPNLDRLFKEGTSLRQYYVVGCTCAPSRAALMSGRHPATFEFRLGLGLAAVGTPALTEVFGAAGYAVAHFGKWHLGPERPYYAARRADDGSTHLGIHTVVSSGKELPCALPEEERRGKARRYTGRGRDEAVYYAAERWVERHAARPWYANVWGHSTHDPVFNCDLLTAERGLDTPPPPPTFDPARFSEHHGLSPPHTPPRSASQIDVIAEKVPPALLLVRLTDPRPPLTFAGESPFLMGYAGGLRGGKFTQYDGGVRVPLLVRWPGVVQAGHDAEEMVELSAEQPRVVQRLLELVRQWNQSLASTRTSSLTSAEESPSMPMGRRLARKAKRVKLKRQAGHPTGNKSRKDADCWEIAYGPRPGEVPNASPPPPWL